MKTNQTPVFILEENNEAFLAWHYAIKNNLLNKENNTLLHVDEHIDMSTPRLKTSIFDLCNNYEEVVKFTYNELSINTYIVPALMQGIFNKIYWLKGSSNSLIVNPRKRRIRTFNNEGKKFLIANCNTKPSNSCMIERTFTLYPSSFDKLVLTSHHNVVLDISLSYFSLIVNPTEYKVNYIEITENEYSEFQQNFKYHNLRYELLGHRIEAIKENGKYYYVLNDHSEVYSMSTKTKESDIKRSVNGFILNLKKLNIKPRIITITRSSRSGYTPFDQIEYIESLLLEGLKELYSLNIETVDVFSGVVYA